MKPLPRMVAKMKLKALADGRRRSSGRRSPREPGVQARDSAAWPTHRASTGATLPVWTRIRSPTVATPDDGDEHLFPPHQPYPPEDDPVDEASEESFPASDAPSTWSRED